MRKYKIAFTLISALFMLLAVQSLVAQNGVIIEQVEKTYTRDAFYELYTDNEIWDNPDMRKKTFLATDLIKLEQAANEIGQPPAVERSTIYLQGEMFRMDSKTDAGEMTVIFRKDLGMMYQIDWTKNIVLKMSAEDIEKMRKGAMDMAKRMQKNMPANIEKMLQGLPEEQRKKALEALKASGQDFPGMTEKKAKPTITDLHNRKDFANFPNCNEFRVVDGNKYIAIWAYSRKPHLSKMFHTFTEEFKSSFDMEDEEIEPEELLPKDKFPVLTITYEENMMGGNMDFQTQLIEKVQETRIPISVFEAYKDPKLKEGSMMDMMNMDRGKRK
ncbi:MAG: hypothetical protein ACE5HX_12040 [bacterium]